MVEFLVKVDLEVAGAFSIFIGAIGQVLRITFNNIDYSFQILNSHPVSRETAEIEILLDAVSLLCIAALITPHGVTAI